MSKKIALLIALCISLFEVKAYVNMIRVNPYLFIHQPDTNWSAIAIKQREFKIKRIKELFDLDMLNHEMTKAFDGETADFRQYLARFEADYTLVDLNNDGITELIYSGYITKEDDRERFQLYVWVNNQPTIAYNEIGHLLAFKIQPNTKEVVLFHHEYPCCENASHIIHRLRLTKALKINQLKRYFLGRDKADMKGVFFPKSVQFGREYKELNNEEQLRWSGSIINESAWIGRSNENIISRYEKGTVYKVLAVENGWSFVLMHGPPKKEENKVINPNNFNDLAVYGWMRF